ncbi:Dps family protein [Cohnella yongneupensis]|uniref:DNA starvation/stationary phase protection protein n=1 Tax=Cohnella yongneupensis TaxID=425006 RepID=A0ABW0R5J5_9BACL
MVRKVMNNLQEAMNVQLANWAVLYVKLHHKHWYVKGPHFPTLHAKFEELYDLAAEKWDELAERILTIEGKPASTMKEYLELATIKEADKGGAESDILAGAIEDLKALVSGLEDTAMLATEVGDDATADLFIGQIGELQKQVWLLSATLA